MSFMICLDIHNVLGTPQFYERHTFSTNQKFDYNVLTFSDVSYNVFEIASKRQYTHKLFKYINAKLALNLHFSSMPCFWQCDEKNHNH